MKIMNEFYLIINSIDNFQFICLCVIDEQVLFIRELFIRTGINPLLKPFECSYIPLMEVLPCSWDFLIFFWTNNILLHHSFTKKENSWLTSA